MQRGDLRDTKPSDRPASAREVAEALEACHLLPWTQDDAVTWWERHLPATSALRLISGPPATTASTVGRI